VTQRGGRACRAGLIGSGSFGSFLAGILADERHDTGAQLVAVADADADAAARLARGLPGVAVEADVDRLLSGHDLELAVIATPPWTHAELAVRAIEAGCHVLVEKPLALDRAGCRRITAAAVANDRVVAVDHMLRFAPMIQAVGRLLAVELDGQPILGSVRRFAFENDASDEDLAPDHWFWDPTRSGGIFVEHGVHFFDLASWLIDEAPQTVQATALATRTDRAVDTVCATARFAGATATWYHSFSHPRRGERQRLRLDLGIAECQLDGWIPLELRLEAWVDPAAGDALAAAVDPTALAGLGEIDRQLALEDGRLRLRLAHTGADTKQAVYARCVAGLVTDVVDAITWGRPPMVGPRAASEAVTLAVAATEAAASGTTVALPLR
jgi:predicted dehydrogenase